MSKLIIDCETNEIVERELTSTELEQQASDQAVIDAAEEAAQAEAAAKEAARQAILDKIGLTAEEAKILLS